MIHADVASIFIGYSLLVLLVMCVERYLGASFPIFHGTSVTRRRFLTLLAILLICQTIFGVLAVNDLVISQSVYVTIFVVVTFPLFLFTNLKLFKICRQIRRREPISPGQRMTRNLKNISTCLLAVACIGLLSIPTCACIIFNSRTKSQWDSKAALSYIWTATLYNMNCTFNSLIFFSKNKVLRIQGIKILNTLKAVVSDLSKDYLFSE